MTIYPTHHCFDDALELLLQFATEDPDRPLTLVHGIARFPEGQAQAGTVFAHAWVECGGQAWNVGLVEGEPITYSVERAEYYAHMRVISTTRYSVREAAIANRRSGTFGPWDPTSIAVLQATRRTPSVPAVREDVDATPD